MNPQNIPLNERVIVALDVPDVAVAERIVAGLGDTIGFYKIGMQLQFARGGIEYAQTLIGRGKKVFLDAKLLDIDETVERAAENIAAMGVSFLTVHGQHTRTIQAAVRGRGAKPLGILAVTVLTSLDAADLEEAGLRDIVVQDMVVRRARAAAHAGADGVIASGEEAAAIRAVVPSSFKIITPGIRRAKDAVDDQKRITTPAAAIKAGADHLVIGRPITKAADPRAQAEAILAEIAGVLA